MKSIKYIVCGTSFLFCYSSENPARLIASGNACLIPSFVSSRRLEALKQKSKRRRQEIAEEQPSAEVGEMDAACQAEYFWRNIGTYLSGLTEMELQEIKPEGKSSFSQAINQNV